MLANWGDKGLLRRGSILETKGNVEETNWRRKSIYTVSFALENDWGSGKEFVGLLQVEKGQ